MMNVFAYLHTENAVRDNYWRRPVAERTGQYIQKVHRYLQMLNTVVLSFVSSAEGLLAAVAHVQEPILVTECLVDRIHSARCGSWRSRCIVRHITGKEIETRGEHGLV